MTAPNFESRMRSWTVSGSRITRIAGTVICAILLAFASSAAARPQSCDDGLKISFRTDPNTKVIAVRLIAKGTKLSARASRWDAVDATAATDICLVKLIVGPGSTNEPDRSAPGWSAGIGIEVWLPAPLSWNHRLRAFGGGGLAGGSQRQPVEVGSPQSAIVAANLGFATASMDAGHEPLGDVSFAFLSNGKLNAESLNDFIARSVVELGRKSKALAAAYYGEAPRYSYFEGGSQGGRQALQAIEHNPELYDGYLVGYPGVYATRFGVGAVYPQLVLRDELGFTSIDKAKIDAFLIKADFVTARAVKVCDREHLGFLLDPFACSYDPLKDAGALCAGVRGSDGAVGTNTDTASCVSAKEAGTIDRIWYGQTRDGSRDPNQTVADRAGGRLAPNQIWWGFNRGAPLAPRVRNAYTDNLVQATGRIDLAADANATGFPPLRNASTQVRNGWLKLSYADLADASDEGMASPIYGPYATNATDLSKLSASGAKVLMYVPLSDELIPPAGTLYWFQKAAAQSGGYARLGKNFRTYLLPGLLHGEAHPYAPGGDNSAVPAPTKLGGTTGRDLKEGQLFEALMAWVERGNAPKEIVITSQNGAVSYPMCVFPKKTTWNGRGSTQRSQNYSCK